jgi:hypothetical protein
MPARQGRFRQHSRTHREEADDERVLLALEHDGASGPRPAGSAGWSDRPSGTAFLSVRSVDRGAVTRAPQQATVATIALACLER